MAFEDKSIKIYLTQLLLFTYSIFNSLYSHLLVNTWYLLACSVDQLEPDFGPARKPAYSTTTLRHSNQRKTHRNACETVMLMLKRYIPPPWSDSLYRLVAFCCLWSTFILVLAKSSFIKTLRTVAARRQDGIFKFRHFNSRNGCRNTIWAQWQRFINHHKKLQPQPRGGRGGDSSFPIDFALFEGATLSSLSAGKQQIHYQKAAAVLKSTNNGGKKKKRKSPEQCCNCTRRELLQAGGSIHCSYVVLYAASISSSKLC